MSVTVVIPTIPPRAGLRLDRAVSSAEWQTVPTAVIVEEDAGRTGSAATRNRALARVRTDWLLCLDDDDELMPNAVQVLTEAQAVATWDAVWQLRLDVIAALERCEAAERAARWVRDE